MTTSHESPFAPPRARATTAWVAGRKVWIELDDGREVGFPADKLPRLAAADDVALAAVRIEARGTALRWEELDEDLTIDGILAGRWFPLTTSS